MISTHYSLNKLSRLDSSLGRMPACDAGDLGSIPGGGNLNACPLNSVADPGSGAFLTPGSGIRNRFFPDPGTRILDPNPIFLRT